MKEGLLRALWPLGALAGFTVALAYLGFSQSAELGFAIFVVTSVTSLVLWFQLGRYLRSRVGIISIILIVLAVVAIVFGFYSTLTPMWIGQIASYTAWALGPERALLSVGRCTVSFLSGLAVGLGWLTARKG